MKVWDGKDLEGRWRLALKIDGVKAIVRRGVARSRAGKRLYNLSLPDGEYEIFKDNWETSVSLVRTHDGPTVPKRYCYRLAPTLDRRLALGRAESPARTFIWAAMRDAVRRGYEGLVLTHIESGKQLKVKSIVTYDTPILGWYPGKGKHTGRMGGFVTAMGKVGTGLTDAQRTEFMALPVGTLIEVECMSLTPAGKFRHPRFKRVRFDKA